MAVWTWQHNKALTQKHTSTVGPGAAWNAARMSQTSFPALDFPLYGLADWHGSRWLDVVEGEIGKPTWGVWLAHGDTVSASAPYPWVRVATLPAARHAQLMTMPDEQPAEAVAFAALHVLINVTAPELTAAQRELYWPRARDMVQRDAHDISAWPEVVIQVDGRDVRAHSYSWAGTWLALTTHMDGVALIVISAGVPPEKLALTRLGSGSDYHFDLKAPIDYPGTLESSAGAALNGSPSWTRGSIHPDQQQLLSPQLG